MMSSTEKVVVVGGGIIGLASAHFLQESGFHVTVIDKAEIGKGCSHGNCGLICPDHIMPLPRPGVLKKGLTALFNPGGAFSIKPRLNSQLWKWLFAFARRCNKRDMLEAGKGRHALLGFSREFYASFIEKEKVDCDWEEKGCLFVYGSEKTLDQYDPINQVLTDQYDLPARKLNGEELEKMEPAFRPGVAAGAWYYEQDAHLRADRLILGWRRSLEARGVKFIENCEVQKLSGSEGKAKGVYIKSKEESEAEEIQADSIVFATGAWSPLHNKEFGCNIPVQPGKGYSITMPRPEICPQYPMILEDEKVAITPMQSGYRLGSMMEFAGYDTSLKKERLTILRTGSKKYLKEPFCEPIEETWYGWRPMTPNGLPIISHVPKYNNVVVAAGHNMIGLMAAPATGRHVAELVSGKPTSIEAGHYQIPR